MNRTAKRVPLFEHPRDYEAFERIIETGVGRFRIALFAYCLMPNHWHFVISPLVDGQLSAFMHWLTTTHARRWQLVRGLAGYGAVYQGRFRAIPISCDHHFLWVCRYVERNALRASLVERAEDWPWCSLWQRGHHPGRAWLSQWPVSPPPDWLAFVNEPQTRAELERFRGAMRSGTPFGEEAFRLSVGSKLGLIAPSVRGRPSRTAASVLNK